MMTGLWSQSPISAMKRCSKCEEEKPLDAFGREAAKRDGRRSECKICGSLGRKERWKNDPEYREKMIERTTRWKKENTERVRITTAKWKKENTERVRIQDRIYQKRRRLEDLNYRLKCNLRSRISRAVRHNKAGSAVRDLGCSVGEFRVYMEGLFCEGMTWSNYGFGMDKWNIDHIIPLSCFNLSDPEQLKKACHYTNLQPLWMPDNIRKSNAPR